MITVLAPGPLLTVQDLGRPGHGAWGVAPGGAADRGSHRLANRLVGNDDGAATLEVTLGGTRLRFAAAATVVITGAPAPLGSGGRQLDHAVAQWIPAGAELGIGTPAYGVRSYLAVRGGITTAPILGSRATDPASGFGRALTAGDELPVGARPARPVPGVDVVPQPPWARPAVVEAVPGPRADWCAPGELARLVAQTWRVGSDSDRVGVRLLGEPLRRLDLGELPSMPALRGAVELPPDGQPIVFGSDHPTTCGYPVIAVLEPAGVDRLAQVRPGDSLQLRWLRGG